jgi:CubicO group peptidase (beta-lactamase class C family)
VGIGLLGLVIERASKTSFAQYMHDAIIKPLGLNHTSVDHPLKLSDAFITKETADGDLSEGFEAR